jgi:hypothetical protein
VYLAQMIRSNVRELEGTLIRLAAKSSLTGRPVDLAFARAELSAAMPQRAQPQSVEDIQRAVCHHFHLRSTDLVSKDRHKSVRLRAARGDVPLQAAPEVQLPEIGRAFGNRDHTTVMSAVRKIEAQRDADPQVRSHIEARSASSPTNKRFSKAFSRRPQGRLFFFVDARREPDCGGHQFKVNPLSLNWYRRRLSNDEKFRLAGRAPGLLDRNVEFASLRERKTWIGCPGVLKIPHSG